MITDNMVIVIAVGLSICIIALFLIDLYEYNKEVDTNYLENMQKFNDEFYLEQVQNAKQYVNEERILPIVGANNVKKAQTKRRKRVQTRARESRSKVIKQKSTKAIAKTKQRSKSV